MPIHDILDNTQRTQNERVQWIVSGLNHDKLTDWEQKFVESVEKQSINGKTLTLKQIEILERICKEKSR
jgi:hypothetical protein